MPKVTVPSLPLSAIFAVVKPSGPTCMSIINDLKNIVAGSRLFVEEGNMNPDKSRKRGKKREKGAVKIGQGGTLDPLADGVLGE